MYKYYKEVNTVEHFCFASEICDSLGVYSNNNKPHVRFFTYFYDGYCKIVGINEDDKIKHSLRRLKTKLYNTRKEYLCHINSMKVKYQKLFKGLSKKDFII